jgi:hypothetical protein
MLQTDKLCEGNAGFHLMKLIFLNGALPAAQLTQQSVFNAGISTAKWVASLVANQKQCHLLYGVQSCVKKDSLYTVSQATSQCILAICQSYFGCPVPGGASGNSSIG